MGLGSEIDTQQLFTRCDLAPYKHYALSHSHISDKDTTRQGTAHQEWGVGWGGVWVGGWVGGGGVRGRVSLAEL